eukprot:CAMPEP_0174863734 /NCGR_PEP_ID=MMETSP1114-20130205/56843_1 /TAXON_ID=312471 /ORGANISM="Neobodo designis, Strain CCAP 1951/1" /LENGTH=61 /DNA_ID=CAMNT_0016098811 /DNA_START=35 /DNA_END=217 /DNA_ORIENTATION=+
MASQHPPSGESSSSSATRCLPGILVLGLTVVLWLSMISTSPTGTGPHRTAEHAHLLDGPAP